VNNHESRITTLVLCVTTRHSTAVF